MKYFISDFHFGHEDIINFERTQFKTIEEHDRCIEDCLRYWAFCLKEEDEFWVLGDWGDISNLNIMDLFKCHTVFVYGNHDKQNDYEQFFTHFDQVYLYSTFIDKRIAVSHIPIAAYDDTVNIHGHLHGAIIDKPNYITCSINDTQYRLVSEKDIQNLFSKMKKYDRRFLYEPFCEDYVYTNHAQRKDLICDKNGKVDIAASKALREFINRYNK